MSIEELVKLMPPPAEPLFPGSDALWRDAEAALGIQFPKDYIEFKTKYGAGLVVHETERFYLSHPFGPEGLDVSGHRLDIEHLHLLSEGFYFDLDPDALDDDEPIYTAFENGTGLFPIGSDTNSRILCWHVDPSRELWDIVGFYPDEPEFECFKMPITVFLSTLLAGKLDSQTWQEPFFKDPASLEFQQTAGFQ
ncbi:MAG: SMI1/KNR4 family protein [bacterium]|nr:SMI1/KNR4 family protein [bacterium]